MWLKFKQLILSLFASNKIDGREIEQNDRFARNYYDISKENITAIIANELSILAFGDATVNIEGENKRAEYLKKISENEFLNSKCNVAAALGTGTIISVPYTCNILSHRKICIDTITKDRIISLQENGGELIQCVVLSDYKTENSTEYVRWTEYIIENGTYIIRNKATSNGHICSLSVIKEWANIPPEIRISNVDRLPIGVFNCPSSGRRKSNKKGFPITYGCDATIDKIEKTLDDIEREFDKKKARIFGSKNLFKTEYDSDGNKIKNTFDDELFIKLGNGDDKSQIDIFDPAIRESAFYTKLQNHFAFLEKEIGCSRGILTDLTVYGATATEIKRAMYSTFCLIDDIHKEYEKYYKNLMYGVDVLCNYSGITPQGDYNIKFDWGLGLLEDTDTTYNQLSELESRGLITGARLNSWVTGQSLEEAEKEIQEVQRNNPNAEILLGE